MNFKSWCLCYILLCSISMFRNTVTYFRYALLKGLNMSQTEVLVYLGYTILLLSKK